MVAKVKHCWFHAWSEWSGPWLAQEDGKAVIKKSRTCSKCQKTQEKVTMRLDG